MNLFTRSGRQLAHRERGRSTRPGGLASLEETSPARDLHVPWKRHSGEALGTEAQGTLDVENGAISGFPGIRHGKSNGRHGNPSLSQGSSLSTRACSTSSGKPHGCASRNPPIAISPRTAASLSRPLDLKCLRRDQRHAFNAFLGALKGLHPAEARGSHLQEILGGLVSGASGKNQ